MLRNKINFNQLIQTAQNNIYDIQKKKLQKAGFVISYQITSDKTAYISKLKDICTNYVNSSFCGYINIYAGEHRIDYHSLTLAEYLCEYGHQPTRIRYNQLYGAESPTVELTVESGYSAPTIKVTPSRNPTYLQILVEVIPSNHIMIKTNSLAKKNFLIVYTSILFL